jgi:hypothetical protein
MKTLFAPTDIIPILNKIRSDTLGDKKKAKKSIQDLGWGPLTYVLLDHPDGLSITMSTWYS